MASESGNKGLSGKKRNTPEDLLEHTTHLELENRWLEARLKTSEEGWMIFGGSCVRLRWRQAIDEKRALRASLQSKE
ncbi:hypothetical protein R1sor_009212 [Riccia sorocarpa]|uniref:Uncharacterized protein n=1 Tax=Riccia sorocarpa TaxID=122646 RepID=A0ABD3H5C3_9MARC